VQYSFWHRVPFVRFLLPFAAGITLSLFTQLSYAAVASAFAACFLLFLVTHFSLVKYKYAFINGFLLHAMLFTFGTWLNMQQHALRDPLHFSNLDSAEHLLVQVNEVPSVRERTVRLQCVALGTHSHSTCAAATGKLVLYLQKDSQALCVRFGSHILLNSRVVRPAGAPRNPGEFDYKRYLQFHQVFHQAYATGKDYQVLPGRDDHSLMDAVYATQEYFRTTLISRIGSQTEAAVAQALLYGYDDDIDPEVVQAYANTGTLHVLAVSGMHVGIIFMILGWLLGFMDRSARLQLVKNLIIMCCLWLYSLLCGLSPSILRATVMFSFILFSRIINRHSNVYNTLAASAFVLICTDTNMIANVGFQLSYLAVVGIIAFQPMVYAWFTPKTRFMDEVWKITAVSLAAQVTTFPVGLLYFHQFPNYFLFSNLIIIPLTTGILYTGILLLVFSKIALVATWLGKLMLWGIMLTNYIVKEVELLPGSFVTGIHISIPETIMIYVMSAGLIGLLLTRRGTWLMAGLGAACCLLISFSRSSLNASQQQELVVYDVPGHTAANLITGTRSWLVIDSSLWNQSNKVRYHLQQHFWSSRITQQQQVFTQEQGFELTLNGNRFAFIHSLPDTATAPHRATLIMESTCKARDLAPLEPSLVIITSAVKNGPATRLKRELLALNIPVVYVGDSGAYRLSL
jgi:competence protein ComEC